MALVDDNEILPGSGEIVKPLHAVAGGLVLRPTTLRILRFDGIDLSDDLAVSLPGVLPTKLDISAPIARQNDVEGLSEECVHLDDPLKQQALGSENENALDHPAQFQLLVHRTRRSPCPAV